MLSTENGSHLVGATGFSRILRAPEVSASGGIRALELYGNPKELMVETKERMFAV